MAEPYSLDDAKCLWDAETAAFRDAVERGASEEEIVAAVAEVRAEQLAERIGKAVRPLNETLDALGPVLARAAEALARLAALAGSTDDAGPEAAR